MPDRVTVLPAPSFSLLLIFVGQVGQSNFSFFSSPEPKSAARSLLVLTVLTRCFGETLPRGFLRESIALLGSRIFSFGSSPRDCSTSFHEEEGFSLALAVRHTSPAYSSTAIFLAQEGPFLLLCLGCGAHASQATPRIFSPFSFPRGRPSCRGTNPFFC